MLQLHPLRFPFSVQLLQPGRQEKMRPVFMSPVKPKVDVVAVVYSCYSNSGCVVFL